MKKEMMGGVGWRSGVEMKAIAGDDVMAGDGVVEAKHGKFAWPFG